MTQVSKPLIGLLLATVVFFALWTVALKPHGSNDSGSGSASQGLGQYQADINAAHKAVQTANSASGRGGTVPSAGAAAPARPAASSHATATATATGTRTTVARATTPKRIALPAPSRKPAATRLAAVEHALRSHRVLALLFYNPGAPDDRAIRQELAGVATHGGRVFKLAIPVNEIARYTSITEELSVNLSPTLVLVAPDRQTDEIVGYADPLEISQRIGDALALR